MQNDLGQSTGAADANSKVPDMTQSKDPRSMGTGSSTTDTSNLGTNKSHATGDSVVPGKIQEKVPEKLEKVLPNALHDTS